MGPARGGELGEWIARRVFPESAREAMRRGVSAGADRFEFAEPAEYAGACLAALAAGQSAWCLNPKWGESERAEAAALIAADDPERPGLRLATGGTGGRVKFVRHTLATLDAAVAGFSQYAGERLTGAGAPAVLSAVQALPVFHVSGLLPVVRAWRTGGVVVFMDGSMRGALPAVPAEAGALTVVSLVSTQLHRLLDRPDGAAWLRGAGLVLVGGSAVSPALLDRARAARLPLGVSYGMTETAALVALYPPAAFLAAESPVAGELLPHVRAAISGEGRVLLGGASLGDPVERDAEGMLITSDEGFLDTRGRLVVTGRADRIVVCGGEKVDLKETEAAIRATGLVRDALVVAVPDAEWGRVPVAFIVPPEGAAPLVTAHRLSALMRDRYAPARRPGRVVEVAEAPRDEKGKVDQARVRELLR